MRQLYAGINNRKEQEGLSYELPTNILSYTSGDFLIVCPDDSDKFYFLHKMRKCWLGNCVPSSF